MHLLHIQELIFIFVAPKILELHAVGLKSCHYDHYYGAVHYDQPFSPVIASSYGYCVQDLAEEAGTSVNGGQTVVNPWMTIGGVATTVCQSNEFIMWVLGECILEPVLI